MPIENKKKKTQFHCQNLSHTRRRTERRNRPNPNFPSFAKFPNRKYVFHFYCMPWCALVVPIAFAVHCFGIVIHGRKLVPSSAIAQIQTFGQSNETKIWQEWRSDASFRMGRNDSAYELLNFIESHSRKCILRPKDRSEYIMILLVGATTTAHYLLAEYARRD